MTWEGKLFRAQIMVDVLAKNDGFIITAYRTSKIDAEEIVWQREL